MERLTTRFPDGGARRNCNGCEMQKICGPYDCLQRMVNRLASYEDTELTPEEIEDLASVREISPEAEYAINAHADSIIERLDKLLKKTDDDARVRELTEADSEGRVVVLPCRVGATVYRIFAPKDREPVISAHTLMSVDYIVRWLDKFGKTVFLTREEAEKATKGETEK